MRELNPRELGNSSYLIQNDVPFGLLEVTATGLKKSILDATLEFRAFLGENAIHDFERQPQGPEFKVLLPANLVRSDGSVERSRASLYRPMTKQGDPRVWFQKLNTLVAPGDIVCVIWAADQLWLLDLSAEDLEQAVGHVGQIRNILLEYVQRKAGAVGTLLDMLRGVSQKGYLRAPVKGSTAVGRLLETELGIEINSRKDPDFRGIEIKSSRSSSNRTTLFAKTPDWAASRYKSSRELLDAFGYDRSGHRKLSCTISGLVANSQHLRLEVDEARDLLFANYEGDRPHRAVQWELEVLRHSLARKHNETFWVSAESKQIEGWEYIRFTSVKHTRRPIISQLSPLLRDGKVTTDFLIREEGDKGYLFKILPKNLGLLFPPPAEYELFRENRVQNTPIGG